MLTDSTMTRTNQLFFLLLRLGLNTAKEQDLQEIPTLLQGPIDWDTLYRMFTRQGVLAVALDGLKRMLDEGLLSPEEGPSRALRIQWAGNVLQAEQRYAKQLELIERLALLYATEGIDLMILKGYGLSLTYPVPEHRTCSDIDIWLFGRQREADRLVQQRYSVEIDEEYNYHTTFYLDGILVENHFHFLNIQTHHSNRRIEARLQAMVQRPPKESLRVGEATVYLPPANFDALFLLRHAAAHFAAIGIGARYLIDWAMFVQRYHSQIDWQMLERVAREENMHRFLYCLCAFAIDCLGIDPELFPAFERDAALEERVLDDILHPQFSKKPPKGSRLQVMRFKLQRWWAYRWKHRLVYRESQLRLFLTQGWSLLRGPKPM